MRVIPPLTITDTILTSSTAAEPGSGEVLWNAATNYAVGATVYRPNHKRYENLIAGVDATLPENAPTRWLELGPTNRWAMFDLLRNTQTEQASPLTVTLTPGTRVNSLALLGLVADAVTVTVTNGGAQVYTHTENLNTREVLDWYDYFFADFSFRPSLVLFDLPPYANPVISVTMTRSTGNVKCGSCVIGSYEDLGKVLYEAESDTLNFSRIDRDAFGNSQLIPRRNVPKTVQNIILDKTRVNRARAVRDALNAVPAVWSGLDDDTDGYFEALFILGIYKRFTINLSRPTEAVISLELEEI